MSNNNYSRAKDINTSAVILWQVNRVNDIMSTGYDDVKKYARKFKNSILALETNLLPRIDEEYKKRIREIEEWETNEKEELEEKRSSKQRRREKEIEIDAHEKKYGAIIQLLARKGMMYDRSYEFVVKSPTGINSPEDVKDLLKADEKGATT